MAHVAALRVLDQAWTHGLTLTNYSATKAPCSVTKALARGMVPHFVRG